MSGLWVLRPEEDGSDATEMTLEQLRGRIAELERALGRHEQNASVAAHTTTREDRMEQERAVMVTTQYRGVFFGYAPAGQHDGRITLRRARMAIYWSAEMRGVLGLAVQGPDRGCRIGPAVDEVELLGVTAVVACTPQAAERWESAPWS